MTEKEISVADAQNAVIKPEINARRYQTTAKVPLWNAIEFNDSVQSEDDKSIGTPIFAKR